MHTQPSNPAAEGEAAIHAAGLAMNKLNPTGEAEIRQAVALARSAALAVKNRSESTGWQIGEFTGLPIALFQNWLYEKNRRWRFTDGTLCVLWCIEFPHSRSDYAKNHGYIRSTRRDYNNGKHQAPAPPEPCVGYDSRGEPVESAPSQRASAIRSRVQSPPSDGGESDSGPSPGRSLPVPPALAVQKGSPAIGLGESPSGPRGEGRITTDPLASSARLAALETYMAEQVLGQSGFVCASYARCVGSHDGQFFEGQLHHIGKHFDAFVNGQPLRVVVVGQEYGNGPARVTLSERYLDVAVRTGLQKHFKRTGALEGRNPHMRGTTSLLRLIFGRDVGERHEDEFFGTPCGPAHLYDMFALVNFLLCSAIASGEPDRGSKHGRSTPTMHANCARHFVRTIEILQPTLVVAQGKGTAQWLTPNLKDEVVVSPTLRWARIGNHLTLLATFSHPSAQGPYNWADLSRPYLRDVVTPTIRAARQLLLGVGA